MTGHARPEHIPEGAKAVVRARADLIGRWTYDLWIVDAEAWVDRLTKAGAIDRLMAEGSRKSRARQLVGRARVQAERAARSIA